MTKKDIFIKIVQELIFDNEKIDQYGYSDVELNDAFAFFESLKVEKARSPITENGKKILDWMIENFEQITNPTSKEIAEGLFTSGRSVSGSIRKLVTDGYVEKIGKNPVQYTLTEKGKNYSLN